MAEQKQQSQKPILDVAASQDYEEYDDEEYESEISGSNRRSQRRQSIQSMKKKRVVQVSSSGASCEINLSNRKSNGFNDGVRIAEPPSQKLLNREITPTTLNLVYRNAAQQN